MLWKYGCHLNKKNVIALSKLKIGLFRTGTTKLVESGAVWRVLDGYIGSKETHLETCSFIQIHPGANSCIATIISPHLVVVLLQNKYWNSTYKYMAGLRTDREGLKRGHSSLNTEA